jgi:DNA-binding transcriptional ArsR family regulator
METTGDPSTKETCETRDRDAERVRRAQQRLIDDATATRLADTFKALSDPTRVRIISALLQDELCVYELADAVGASQSAVSHQLATLREMRLVRFRKDGRHVFYTLDDDHIYHLFRQGLEHISHE